MHNFNKGLIAKDSGLIGQNFFVGVTYDSLASLSNRLGATLAGGKFMFGIASVSRIDW